MNILDEERQAAALKAIDEKLAQIAERRSVYAPYDPEGHGRNPRVNLGTREQCLQRTK